MKTDEPIYINKSKIENDGVLALRFINKDEVICKMRGEKISSDELHKITESGRDIVVDGLQVGEREYLNLEKPYVLINHSCNPNAGIRGGDLIAIRDINKGEEITYDYSSTWFDGFMCNCGSKNCRGHIGDFTAIPKSVQKKYLKLGIVPDFIRKNIKI